MTSDDGCHRLASDAASHAVLGPKPISNAIGAFARIACDAASRDVLRRNDARIVDDVLPRRSVAPMPRSRRKLHPAVDAAAVALDHLALQPARDAPAVHPGDSARAGGQLAA